ncbi:hypothetical protein JTB14_001799 [Gonioctena quinquepunctata]|nr:hypothetical protein JTB14_001799 [Gonioctena quinquepunctata]
MLNNPHIFTNSEKISSIVRDKPRVRGSCNILGRIRYETQRTHLLEPKARQLSLFVSTSMMYFCSGICNINFHLRNGRDKVLHLEKTVPAKKQRKVKKN